MPGRKNPMCNTFPRIGDVINMWTVDRKKKEDDKTDDDEKSKI